MFFFPQKIFKLIDLGYAKDLSQQSLLRLWLALCSI